VNQNVTEYSDVEYVFDAHASSIPDLREYVASLWDRRVFMRELARADIRTLRSNRALGSLWHVLDPLFQAGIYFFLYSVLRRGAAQAAFLPVLIGGFYLYGLSLAALNDGGQSIKRARGLMLSSTFPRAMLPIVSVYKSLRTFVPSACVFLVLFPAVGGHFGRGFLLIPLLFCMQVVMNIGVALLVSTFVTLKPDATNFMTYVTRVLFFATPVVYPVALLPAAAKRLIGWQPLYSMFASYQAVFSGGVPSPILVFGAMFWSVALLLLGGWVFLRNERRFAMHL
jgi:ABC-type polysaccharide/polyol phosphate export permease